MIYVGIDDTDTLDTPGTNQLARALAVRVASNYHTALITRHQLLYDARIPYTSKNGSASLLLEARESVNLTALIGELRAGMLAWFKPGSDPGLCVAARVPAEVSAFGRRCQREVVGQDEARALAATHNLHLEGLGGTEGGVIGALAAVGLIATGEDGRVVHIGGWPDDLSGLQPIDALRARGVEVRELATGKSVEEGAVEVGKHLRPNYRERRIVLYVEPSPAGGPVHWQAIRLT
jgi:hypothetical protein